MHTSYAHAVISDHCLLQLAARGLDLAELKLVLDAHDEALATTPERVILHKLVVNKARPYLWRVVMDVESEPPRVITAYITSKIEKYVKEH